MKRTKQSLSHYNLATFDMGQLVPISCFDVLPGDSVRMSSSALLRLSPLMTPVMHPVQVRVHHWYVPFRILWDEWEDFITGGPDGLGATMPTFNSGTVAAGSILDYLGIPPTTNLATHPIVKFPVQAYTRIFNEFYRDQDLVAEVPETSFAVQNCAWEKDYFTSARPWSQKGPDVVVPLSGQVPVVPGVGSPVFNYTGGPGNLVTSNGSANVQLTAAATGIGAMTWNDPKLLADLSGGSATTASINEFRKAFALQRYQEARAQYGSRYTEYLAFLGIRSSDARLQRPEYLGGGRSTISFSEVLRTGNESAATTAPIGEMSGHGIAAVRSKSFIKFFEEHGVVLTLASLRPRTIYGDGIARKWSKTTKEDYYQRELELIGQQEIYNREVYAGAATPAGIFGYNDRYSEYREEPSYVAGDFRTTLNDWHLARQFAAEPVLNGDFVKCDPSKRIFAEQTEDSIWAMFSHSIQARRMLTNQVIGRLF